ncbi:unnamed protein product [Urochloa humidicola]
MTRFCKPRLHHCQLLLAFNSQGIQLGRTCVSALAISAILLGVSHLKGKWQEHQMIFRHLGLPKNGEMLLSVHGSPLGVYKEENLAAIEESGNGNEDAPC